MKKILLAGSTGYLGKYILSELVNQKYSIRSIVRCKSKIENSGLPNTEFVEAELTNPESLNNICDGIDVVITTVGITRQKDGLTYMDVDYQANKNLLDEAIKSGVKKFIYVSVFIGEKLRHLKICEAKEKFGDELKASGIDYTIVRPNGFFSDMTELFNMAKKGRIYLFGNGELKATPIHGKDLAEVCVNAIEKNENRIEVGGPETLTQNEIAETAFSILGKPSKISYIPDFARKLILKSIKTFTGSKTYGPIEFFMTVMAMDIASPEYGKRTIKEFYESLSNSNQ